MLTSPRASTPHTSAERTIGMAEARALFVEDVKMLGKLKDAPVGRIVLLTGEAEGACQADREGTCGLHMRPRRSA